MSMGGRGLEAMADAADVDGDSPEDVEPIGTLLEKIAKRASVVYEFSLKHHSNGKNYKLPIKMNGPSSFVFPMEHHELSFALPNSKFESSGATWGDARTDPQFTSNRTSISVIKPDAAATGDTAVDMPIHTFKVSASGNCKLVLPDINLESNTDLEQNATLRYAHEIRRRYQWIASERSGKTIPFQLHRAISSYRRPQNIQIHESDKKIVPMSIELKLLNYDYLQNLGSKWFNRPSDGQWDFGLYYRQIELTAEGLEELRRVHGPNFANPTANPLLPDPIEFDDISDTWHSEPVRKILNKRFGLWNKHAHDQKETPFRRDAFEKIKSRSKTEPTADPDAVAAAAAAVAAATAAAAAADGNIRDADEYGEDNAEDYADAKAKGLSHVFYRPVGNSGGNSLTQLMKCELTVFDYPSPNPTLTPSIKQRMGDPTKRMSPSEFVLILRNVTKAIPDNNTTGIRYPFMQRLRVVVDDAVSRDLLQKALHPDIDSASKFSTFVDECAKRRVLYALAEIVNLVYLCPRLLVSDRIKQDLQWLNNKHPEIDQIHDWLTNALKRYPKFEAYMKAMNEKTPLTSERWIHHGGTRGPTSVSITVTAHAFGDTQYSLAHVSPESMEDFIPAVKACLSRLVFDPVEMDEGEFRRLQEKK